MKHEAIVQFEMLSEQTEALYKEVKDFAGQEPLKAARTHIATLVTSLLSRASVFLSSEELPLPTVPDDATLADTAAILAVCRSALRNVRGRHTVKRHGETYWVAVTVDDQDPAGTTKTEYVLVNSPGEVA